MQGRVRSDSAGCNNEKQMSIYLNFIMLWARIKVLYTLDLYPEKFMHEGNKRKDTNLSVEFVQDQN